ncbi:MAG: hypothetical protein A2176_07800 [Spirochaetes bacterium RBG_13_51_14]|nr:MAG: hypothetical protein A2176_07800 [Spirochaetes bacterium RBG_13_51_14]
MDYDNYGFPRYVSVSKKRAKAKKSAEKLKKKNPNMKPVVIEGGKIAKTWWGIGWIQNLERYADYDNRIGRGRSYVRHGAVLDLQIEAGKINALVQGSRAKPYSITISIKPVSREVWKNITAVCEGKLASLAELLKGEFPESLAELFTVKDRGLFPSPKQIAFDCSCPDWADMCKHVAAVLYGVGARLDEDPTLFFLLRKANMDDLISQAVAKKSESLLQKAPVASRRIMSDSDISAVFGIEMAEGDEGAQEALKKKTKRLRRTVNEKKSKGMEKKRNQKKAKNPF